MSRWDKIPNKHNRGMEPAKQFSVYPNGRKAFISPSKEFSENFDRIFAPKTEPLDFDGPDPLNDSLMGRK